MNKKHLIFTILFCLYLKVFYFNLVNWAIINFYNTCNMYNIIISPFQKRLFDIITIVYYFFIIAVIVGLFAYWFRHFRLWVYLALGFLIRYLRGISSLFPLLIRIKRETSFYVLFSEPAKIWPLLAKRGDGFLALFSEPKNIMMLLLDMAVTFLAAYFGYRYIKKTDYIDGRDKVDFTFWGFSKRFWCLIIIAFNPILGVLSKYSVISIYEATKKRNWIESIANIFNIEYKGGFFGVLMFPVIVGMFWALSIYSFYIALKAVKNKESEYRMVKIVGILIVLPLAIVLTQMIRKKLWFF